MLLALILVPFAAAAAVGGDERPEGVATASDTGAEGAATARKRTPKRAVLRLRKTRFGRVIHEKHTGLVAYVYSRERGSKPRCYGGCAKAWPPIKTRRRPRAGSGLKQRHLRTTRRRGGARMVTYKGHPLYFYVEDSPGTILCNNVFEFGGTWSVIKRNGKPA